LCNYLYFELYKSVILLLQIHSKKRNRLDSKRLNDLVFVKFNALLKSKFSDTSRDPLAAKSLDSGKVQEWMVGSADDEDNDDDDEIFQGEGLTWTQLGEMVDNDQDTRRPSRVIKGKEMAITEKSKGKRKRYERDDDDSSYSSEDDQVPCTIPTTDDYETDQE